MQPQYVLTEVKTDELCTAMDEVQTKEDDDQL